MAFYVEASYHPIEIHPKSDDDDLNPRLLLVCFVESLNQFFDSLQKQVVTHGVSGGGSCWTGRIGTPPESAQKYHWMDPYKSMIRLFAFANFSCRVNRNVFDRTWWTWWKPEHQKVSGNYNLLSVREKPSKSRHPTCINSFKESKQTKKLPKFTWLVRIFEQKPPSKILSPIGPNN